MLLSGMTCVRRVYRMFTTYTPLPPPLRGGHRGRLLGGNHTCPRLRSRTRLKFLNIKHMTKAEIITIGTEIILGQIVDTNTPYIAQNLLEKGIQVLFQTSVGDDKDLLKSALKIARDRANLIITTGGLGPTANDITREAVSEFFDIPLVPDKEAYVRIQKILKNQRINKQDEYKKQVTVHPHLNLPPPPFSPSVRGTGGGIQRENKIGR